MRYLLILLLCSSFAFAECDFSTITESNGKYIYSTECHKKVGKLVKDKADRAKQVEKLNKSIEVKDLVIDKQEQRIQLWMGTTEKLENRVNSIDRWKGANQWLYFGLGVVATSLSIWLASEAIKKR